VTSTGTGTTASVSLLPAGATYTFSVTDANGCVSPASGNVVIAAQPTTPTAPVVGTITHPTCATATGTVALSGLPATGTWTLTRNPGAVTSTGTGTTASVSLLPAGATYTFTVTDANGCVSPASGNVVIAAQPTTPTAPVVGVITQPTCATATGSVALSGLPATGTWTLTRSPGAVTSTGTGTTASVSLLPAGATYTFSVTDANGCVSPASGNVVIAAQPVTPTAPVVGAITQPTCATATGTVALSGLPATGTWTLTRNPGAVTSTGTGTTASVSLLPAGATYTFTVTDANGCVSPASGNVVIAAQPITPTAPVVGAITNPTCATATGTVALSGLPATGTWTLTRSPGAVTSTGTGTTASVSLLPAGATYTFTVTNSAGWSSPASGNVVIAAQPITPTAPVIGTITQPTCATATGTVALSGLPATGTWTLTRSPGAVTSTGTGTTASVSLLPAGATYTFSVTDANGCVSPASGNVVIAAQTIIPATPVVVVTQQPTCSIATGNVTITSTTTGLNFSVDNGVYAAYPGGGYNLNAGNHTFTSRSTSDNTCISSQATITVNAQPAAPPQPTATVTQQPSCAIPTGTITITSPTPAVGISYSIDGATYINTTGIFTGLSPATYSVTVKNAQGCISASRNLTVNTAPASTLTASATTVDIVCGVNTGTILVTAAGGVPPYTYSLNGAAAVSTNIFAGLSAGTYIVRITDAAGCTKDISAVIDIINSTLTATANVSNIACGSTTGSAVISASGGTPPYTYSLDGGTFGTGAGFTNLVAGAHTIRVKDALNCTFDVSITILPASVPVAPTVSTVHPTCQLATGTITINSPIPASGITYSINGTNYTNTTGIFASISPGTYNVTYKNNAGCTSAATSVTVNPQPPTPAQAIATVSQQPNCTVVTGTITVTQPTPAPGISYSIDGISYSNNTGVFTAVAPGNYNVTVRNTQGCVSVPLGLTINSVPVAPIAPTATVNSQPTCSVATGNVTVTSTTTGFEFSVDNGTFITYPAGGFNLSPGNHNIRARRITDNCISLGTSVTVQAIPTAPSTPTISVTQQPTCSVTTGTVTITSTTANLEFSVDGGAFSAYPSLGYQLSAGSHTVTARRITDISCISTPANIIVNNAAVAPTSPTLSVVQPGCSIATGAVNITSPTTGLQFSVDGATYTAYPTGGYQLSSGSHTITAKRISDDCTSAPTTIIINAQPATPAQPVANVSEQPNCIIATGTIVVTQPAPTSGISYSINGTNYTNITGVFTGVAAGSYPLTVRNAQGCVSPSVTVTVNAAPGVPAQPAATVSQQPNCTVATGTITITQPAPAVGISYSINGTDYANTTGVFTGLTPATYSVTAKNAQGCISAPRSLTVNNVPSSTLAASAIAIDIICGISTGTITVTATGGLPPYTYSLNGATAVNSNIFTLLPAGSYKITVKDALGCIKDVNATVELLNSTLTATASLTNIACGGTTGSAVISASGGTPPYAYSLDGGAFSITSGFTNLSAGQHTVKVRDALSCTYDVSVAILPAPILAAPTVTTNQPTCETITGTVTINTPAPATGIRYSIDGTNYTNTTGLFPGLTPGSYNVTVRKCPGLHIFCFGSSN
jgi:hypothetical protein